MFQPVSQQLVSPISRQDYCNVADLKMESTGKLHALAERMVEIEPQAQANELNAKPLCPLI